MSHSQPVPGGSVSPYPLDRTRSAERDGARAELADKVVPAASADTGSPPWGKIAAGSAIGSAAIAAALLFWNRSRA